MVNAECPSCGTHINLTLSPKMGQQVVCSSCKAELEVVWLEPVQLDWPYDIDDLEDDWDDAYDDED